MAGKLEKLKIIACSDPKFATELADPKPFVTLFNPEDISLNYKVNFDDQPAPNASGVNLKYLGVDPLEISFKLLFDGSGVNVNDRAVGEGIMGPKVPVEDATKQIDHFKAVTLDYNGKIHSPNFVKISWGTMIFKGRLSSLELQYTVFKADGSPLRATANIRFQGSIDDEERTKKEAASSPDLTHVLEVVEGDTLPIMAHRIYGDKAYYLEVARKNGISNFRSLEPGSKIYFPPLAAKER